MMKKMTKLTLAALLASTGLGGAALAGSLQEPVVDATPIAPAPVPVDLSGDWTGFYTGLQLGYADIGGDGGLAGDDNSYGFHAGYDYDLGDWVIGGELDYDQTDIDLNAGAASIDSVARLKLKAGYDLGNTLIYATAGAARADTSAGDETGPFAGLGVTYKINDRFSVGGEVMEHRFDDVGGVAGNDVDATTFTLRGSYRF